MKTIIRSLATIHQPQAIKSINPADRRFPETKMTLKTLLKEGNL